jgi:hypothetical protein
MSISQNFPSESPSLNLDFANCRKLDPKINYVRSASTNGRATSINVDGTIVYSSFNNPRFNHSVKQIRNLYPWSENTPNWSAGGITARNAGAITAPDGSTTGNLVIEDNTNNQHLIFQDIGTVTQGATYTWSIYAKNYSDNRNFALTLHGGSYAVFNLRTGTIIQTGGFTCRMELIDNGWYRCSIAGGFPSTTGRAYALIWNDSNVYTGNGTSGVYVWGGQLEVGSGPSRYVRTTTSTEPSYDITSNGLLMEYQATNLITMSNKSDMGNFFVENAQVKRNIELAPDNTFSADELVATLNGGSNTCFVQKWEPITADTGTYVFSIFLKPGTSPKSTINMQLTGGTYQQTIVDIRWETQTIIGDTGANATITPYGNGWFRVSTAITNNGTNNTIYPRVYVRDQGTANVRGHSVFIWGWQVERFNGVHTFATSYIPSTETFISRASTATFYGGLSYVINTAAVNQARYDYLPAGLDSNFLLLEPASTNLLSYTESLNNWTKGNGATVSSDIAGIGAPNGTISVDKLVESPAASGVVGHYLYYGRNATNETVTFSIFAKRAERSKILIQFSNFVNETAQAQYDLILGTTTLETGLSGTDYVNASAEIIPYHDGWFRCILTATKNAVNNTNIPSISPINASGEKVYTGDGTSGVYLWGAQLESGTSASSYIPATGASNVTRSADIYSTAATTRNWDITQITNINTSTWFNNKTSFGSFYIETKNIKQVPSTGSYTRIIALYNTGNSDYIVIGILPNSLTAYCEGRISGSYITNFVGFSLTGTNDKFVISIDDTELSIICNGSRRHTQFLGASVIDKFNALLIGNDSIGSQTNGEIVKCSYYPYPISIDTAINMTK